MTENKIERNGIAQVAKVKLILWNIEVRVQSILRILQNAFVIIVFIYHSIYDPWTLIGPRDYL